MAESKNFYLVCYDIRDAKRWRKAYKLLQGYGERLQYSIFRCPLTMRNGERLRWQLAQILKDEDSLLIVGLCNRCVERVQACNSPAVWTPSNERFRVI